jgi:beta-lactamase regulating signal transducer with metallopeptidase domain
MISSSPDSLLLGLQRFLLEPAIRSLGLACLVVLSLKLFRVKSSVLRLSIWTGVLYAALGMPLLSWLLPEIPLPLKIFSSHQLVPVAPESGFDLSVNHLSERTANRITTPAIPNTYQFLRRSAPTLVTAIYLLAAGLLLARLCLGWLMSQKLRRASRCVTNARVLERFTIRAKSAQLARTPALGYSANVVVPLTMGIKHPLILLPADWRDWPESKLSAVLEHELSHVARRDYLRQIIAEVHLAIFWFSPLGWLLKSHLAELAEQASDDAALLAVSDNVYYSEVLLGFFTALERQQSRISSQAISMARGRGARRRFDRILADRPMLSPHLKKSAVAGLILLIMPFVYLMAAVQPYAIHRPLLSKVVAAQTVSSPTPPDPETGILAVPKKPDHRVSMNAETPEPGSAEQPPMRQSTRILIDNFQPEPGSAEKFPMTGERNLQAIRIAGSTSFPPEVLESALKIVRLNFPITTEMIEYDIEKNLKTFLGEHGFIQSEVHWSFVPLEGKDVEVRLQITEGPQFRLADLRIKGVTFFAPDYISSQFNLHTGDVVNFSEIKAALGRIKQIYADHGFMNWSYIPEFTFDSSKGTEAFTFTFEEGIQTQSKQKNKNATE